jgi:pimeloyl-ACP methyl ester carboxylesterase
MSVPAASRRAPDSRLACAEGRTVSEVRSLDGTRIAYERTGDGPPLILVDGALCYRGMGPMASLAALLTDRFAVFRYDRRGRGESGDAQPYAVDREVEDISALIDAAGAPVHLYGASSGAALALEAANRGLAIKSLALNEAPFIVDDTRAPLLDDYRVELIRYLEANRRGDAVAHFMKSVGMPAPFALIMRAMPVFSKLKAVAHTLPYDFAIVADAQRGQPLPSDRWTAYTQPILVMMGSKSPAWIRNAMESLATVLPSAELRTLAGQTHMVSEKALAPVLADFFGRPAKRTL